MVGQIMSKFLRLLNRDAGDSGEQALLRNVQEKSTEGDAESVLNAIDTYAKLPTLPKHLEKEQGDILAAEVKKFEKNARIVALELGAYSGYSAIKIASTMKNRTSKLISLETQTFEIAEKIIKHAGIPVKVSNGTSEISSKVTLLKGTLKGEINDLRKLLSEMKASHFNFIFMNHWDDYFSNFTLLKDKSMLDKGTVIVANTKGLSLDQKDFVPKEWDTVNKAEGMTWDTVNKAEGMTVSTWI